MSRPPASFADVAAILTWPSALAAAGGGTQLLVVALSLFLLVLGLRAFRIHMTWGLGLLAAYGGTVLAQQADIAPEFLVVPLGLLGAALAWLRHVWVGALFFGVLCGMGAGLFLFKALELGAAWLGGGVGFALGALWFVVGRRFAMALGCAVVGSVGLLAVTKPYMERAAANFSGMQMAHYPEIFVAMGTGLTIVSLIIQGWLQPDEL